ncbi:MAG: MBL fold metallo-hydrolase, partial [Candidatus Altiarchaeota archaeon]|nr:MBL fold metallo-hydrolase [Candidatus Altiarchaeota archaeon]
MKVDVLVEGCRTDDYSGKVKVSRNICCSVVLIRCCGHNIVVDPGGPDYSKKVLKKISQLKVKPEDVDIIVNTHYHLDHVYNNFIFPKAKIYSGSSIWAPGPNNQVEMFPNIEDAPIPCVKLIKTPGHMDKHISVVFEKDGRTWV